MRSGRIPRDPLRWLLPTRDRRHYPTLALSPACAGEIPGLTTAHNDKNKVSVMCLTPSYRGPETTSTGVNFRWPFGMLPVYLLHRRSSIAARYESADFQRPDARLRRTRYICRRSRDVLADWSSRVSRVDDDLPEADGIVKAPLETLPAHDSVYRRRRMHEEAHLIACETRKS